jgi:alanine dehydrogenase
MKLAQLGAQKAIRDDNGIREGVNTYHGHVTYAAVADSQGKSAKAVASLL